MSDLGYGCRLVRRGAELRRSRSVRLVALAAATVLVPLVAIDASQASAGGGPSTSPLPVAAKHAVQGSPALVPGASQTITFSEFPVGTSISTQYRPQGVDFGGDAPFISTDGANPTSPVLSGTPTFQGAVRGTFVTADGTARTVNGFSLDVGYIDDPGAVVVTVLDAGGQTLQTIPVVQTGIVTVPVSMDGIGGFRVASDGSEGAGFAIDNVTFPGLFPCPTAGQHTGVVLPEIEIPAAANKPFTLEYGELPLTFDRIATAPSALCTVQSGEGVLPVNLIVLGFTQHVADSIATATVSFLPG